jgi:hypothetical protein
MSSTVISRTDNAAIELHTIKDAQGLVGGSPPPRKNAMSERLRLEVDVSTT